MQIVTEVLAPNLPHPVGRKGPLSYAVLVGAHMSFPAYHSVKRTDRRPDRQTDHATLASVAIASIADAFSDVA